MHDGVLFDQQQALRTAKACGRRLCLSLLTWLQSM
jgi:hypothetical protein